MTNYVVAERNCSRGRNSGEAGGRRQVRWDKFRVESFPCSSDESAFLQLRGFHVDVTVFVQANCECTDEN